MATSVLKSMLVPASLDGRRLILSGVVVAIPNLSITRLNQGCLRLRLSGKRLALLHGWRLYLEILLLLSPVLRHRRVSHRCAIAGVLSEHSATSNA